MGCEQNARNPATSIQHQAWNADLNNQYSLAGAFFALRASELGTKDAECDHLASDVVRMILRLGPFSNLSDLPLKSLLKVKFNEYLAHSERSTHDDGDPQRKILGGAVYRF